MSLSKQYNTDKSIEKSGVRVTFGTNADGTEIALILARAGGANSRFQSVADVVLKPYRRQIQNETIEPAVLKSKMIEIYAKTVIKDWENVALSDLTGDEADKGYATHSEENVIALFTRLPDFFTEVQAITDNLSVFRAEGLEEDAKN